MADYHLEQITAQSFAHQQGAEHALRLPRRLGRSEIVELVVRCSRKPLAESTAAAKAPAAA